jgi:hypothetical protein
MPKATIFHVLILNNGRVNPPDNRKTLSRSAGDEVRWIAAGGGPYTIFFPDNPFTGNNFSVSVGNPWQSGPAVNGVIGKAYKYEVLDAARAILDDPDVLIEG